MRILLVLIHLLVFAGPALAADGVLEINQTCAVNTGCFAGDPAGFPVTITEPGSYRLTSPLEDLRSGFTDASLRVSADRVSVDLNGFTINRMRSVACTGVAIDGVGNVVAISNGIVNGRVILTGSSVSIDRVQVSGVCAYDIAVDLGVRCSFTNSSIVPGNGNLGFLGSDYCRVSNSSFDVYLGRAISVGVNSTVSDNIVRGSSDSSGIGAGAGSLIKGNVIRGGVAGITSSDSSVIDNVVDFVLGPEGFGHGISCSACMVKGNTVSRCAGFGLTSPLGPSGYSNNQFNGNNGGDANLQVSGGVDLGGNVCGGDSICP